MQNLRHTHPTIGILAGQPFYAARLSQFFKMVCRGISLAGQEKGCNLLYACGLDSSGVDYTFRAAWPIPDAESDFVPVGHWNTDALLVILPVVSKRRMAYLQELIREGFPVIFIGPRKEGLSVMADNLHGIREATKHLIKHGHQKIAFIAGFPHDLGDSSDRLRAYYSCLEEEGLKADKNLIAFGEHNWFGGQRAIKELLERKTPFTALIASNDESARGALDFLKLQNLRVPDDIAIIGFDDQIEARGVYPSLTTIHNPMIEIGQAALLLALKAIYAQSAPNEILRIPTRLVIRQSCGCSPDVSLCETREPHAGTLVQSMTTAVANEMRYLNYDALRKQCVFLAKAWNTSIRQNSPLVFQDALSNVLQTVEKIGDDAHSWQAAISILGWQEDLPLNARKWLHIARVMISDSARRQHYRYMLLQWVDDDVARITARLLAVKDEEQIVEILSKELPLAQHLPEVSILKAHVILTDKAGQKTKSKTYLLNPQHGKTLSFDVFEFPPQELEYLEPFSIALFPLVFKDEEIPGYVILEMPNLSPYAAYIVQHLAVALHSANLYKKVDERRRQAEEANKVKSRFLSVVSHELRTPLSVIAGVSELALQHESLSSPPLPEQYHQDLRLIHANARHLSDLIEDVLDLAKDEKRQLQLSQQVLDFKSVLQPILEVAERMAKNKGLEWKVEFPEEPLPVFGDSVRLRQITLNLLNNAVKFTEQGYVSLNVKLNKDHITVIVSDSGIGIPEDEQFNIFNEFQQSQRSSSRGYGGAGLGLAITKRLVELHGGTIGVLSPGQDGVGSAFFYQIPCQAERLPKFSQSKNPKRGQIVILYEQNYPSHEITPESLKLDDFEVTYHHFNDEYAWRKTLENRQPLAVVLQVRQETEKVWKIYKDIRAIPNNNNTRVLLYSVAENESQGSFLELDYIKRPIRANNLWQNHEKSSQASLEQAQTILIVDDETAILDLHARMLQEYKPSLSIIKASSGHQALEIIKDRHIDLLLLDLMMPGIDGFGVLESLRAGNFNQHVPVIVLTAQILNEEDMNRLSKGAAKVLGKGVFTLQEILEHINITLEQEVHIGSETHRLVQKAMAYIHIHFAEPIQRKDISLFVNVHEDYLTHCFHKELGVSPIRYITRHRLTKAKKLLKSGNMTVTEVASSVGFNDTSYFCRVFRKEEGLSPKDYQKGKKSKVFSDIRN
jgi:signal transduction histidine kinase/DNA-binding LacI/PurR family transcriptional regulator/AraC-like DNA-binding protein